LSHSSDKAGDKVAARESNEPAAASAVSPPLIPNHHPRYLAFLRDKVGVGFRGRILELGAGPAWFSAELSKLPKVVEVVASDFAARPERDHAAAVFQALQAREAKIVRRLVTYQRLSFPDRHFDFVVCAGGLQDALNLLHLLREARRVLKPGGQFISVREPVKPLVRGRGRELKSPLYSRADFEDLFERAGFALTVFPVSLATGLKYYFDKMVQGLTHARYVFVATRRESAGRGGLTVPRRAR
jgi:SAM-dependent methyltransferase